MTYPTDHDLPFSLCRTFITFFCSVKNVTIGFHTKLVSDGIFTKRDPLKDK